MVNIANSIIEILSLKLKPGSRHIFDQLYKELSVPMLRRWNVDLLAFGPSQDAEDSYLVVRRYKDAADRQQSQDAFYNSEEWKQGPREQIMALIENYTAVVIPSNEMLIEGFRAITLLSHSPH